MRSSKFNYKPMQVPVATPNVPYFVNPTSAVKRKAVITIVSQGNVEPPITTAPSPYVRFNIL